MKSDKLIDIIDTTGEVNILADMFTDVYKQHGWALTFYNNEFIGKKSKICIETRSSCHITQKVICTIDCDKIDDEAKATAQLIKKAPVMKTFIDDFIKEHNGKDLLKMSEKEIELLKQALSIQKSIASWQI